MLEMEALVSNHPAASRLADTTISSISLAADWQESITANGTRSNDERWSIRVPVQLK
jgi:hypothetical protein